MGNSVKEECKNAKQKLAGVSYGRVSTVGQTLDSNGNQREDASPAAQKSRCLGHAQYLSMKSGIEYQIIEHFSDEGFSGKNVNRPNYKKIWNLISDRTINFVIASELSRLSRSVVDFLDLVNHCQKNNVDLIIIGLELDTSSPFGRVIVVILVALAQFEREMTSMRVKENALTRLINDGKINGASEILGLDCDKNKRGHYIVNNCELKIVHTIMENFVLLKSKALTIDKLADLGIKTKKGKKFDLASLTKVLENSRWRYRGLWYANKENIGKVQERLPENRRYKIVPLTHGPLIDEALLAKVIQQLDEYTAKRKIRNGKNNYIYLLSGLLILENCGFYHGEYANKGRYRYYLNPLVKKRISCSIMDSFIFNQLILKCFSFLQLKKSVENSERKFSNKQNEISLRLNEYLKALTANPFLVDNKTLTGIKMYQKKLASLDHFGQDPFAFMYKAIKLTSPDKLRFYIHKIITQIAIKNG